MPLKHISPGGQPVIFGHRTPQRDAASCQLVPQKKEFLSSDSCKGPPVGFPVGSVVGSCVGSSVGGAGFMVGLSVGGSEVGLAVGLNFVVGDWVGLRVGRGVGPMISIMWQLGFITVQQKLPEGQSRKDPLGQCVSMLHFASAAIYVGPQKLVLAGSLYSIGLSVGRGVVGAYVVGESVVGRGDGGNVKSSTLQKVSPQQVSPLGHSSSEPLGHQ